METDLVGPLEIKSLAFGGSGVARFDGRVIFVRGSVPGDLVHARLLVEKKRYAEAKAVRFERYSRQRCQPQCPVFGDCGGCHWQMLPYSEQLRHKEQIFRDILRRHCGIEPQQVASIIESPLEWNYRSRAQFKCHAHSDGGLAIGFFRPNSHFVVNIDSCPLVDETFNRLLPQVRQLLERSAAISLVPQVDMERGDDGRIRLVIHYLGDQDEELLADLEPLQMNPELSLFLQKGRKSSLRHVCGAAELGIEVDAPSLHLAYGAGGFAQVNLQQNRRMVAEVLRIASLHPEQRVLDLYCGMGNFSLPLARRVRSVVGVEEYAGSVEQARANARRNRIVNAEFVARPAQGACAALAEGGDFDMVLLDPPRSGAKEVIPDLIRQRVGRILYVSCDPMTLARDLKELLHGGYRLVETRPLDMFPQTYHMESLTLLEIDAESA